jgi:hypothetical protein
MEGGCMVMGFAVKVKERDQEADDEIIPYGAFEGP